MKNSRLPLFSCCLQGPSPAARAIPKAMHKPTQMIPRITAGIFSLNARDITGLPESELWIYRAGSAGSISGLYSLRSSVMACW